MKVATKIPEIKKEWIGKALALLEEGASEVERGEKIEEEFRARKSISCGCEKVFHAFVELTNAVLAKHGVTPPNSHDERTEALSRIGRGDLADLYNIAKDVLHTSCYYGQRFGSRQKDVIKRVSETIRSESKLL